MNILPIFFLLIIQAFSSSVGFEPCNGEYLMEIKTINAVPWPLRTGLSTQLDFDTSINLSAQKLRLNMTLEMRVGINQWKTIVEENINLCDGILSCPINKGDQAFGFQYTLHSCTPVGNKWRGYIKIMNENDTELACAKLDGFKVK